MIERGDSDPSATSVGRLIASIDAARACALVSITTSGPDPRLDGVVRLRALKRDALDQGFEHFERLCAPPEGIDRDACRATLAAQDVELDDLADAASASDAWADLDLFLGDAPLLVADTDAFDAWRARARGARRQPALGLAQLGELVLPSRALLGGLPRPSDPPPELARALATIAARFLGLDDASLRSICACIAASIDAARRSDRAGDRALAQRLTLALAWLDRPSAWLDACGERVPCAEGLGDRRVTRALASIADGDAAREAREIVESLRPRCAVSMDLLELEPTIAAHGDAAQFADEDLQRLDDVFERHLPALSASADAPLRYREGQHEIARQIARTLGSNELLLVHAPTGTGKTLAYVVPALLWSLRHQRRVGVATFTRALQEQALEREVPRALAALRLAGIDAMPRVALLKGRANYLCWRALRSQAPASDDGAAPWLAWTALVAFALVDADGDLDRFPPRIAIEPGAGAQRELDGLLRAVRAQTACCHQRSDRACCAAEIARARAERSHVVITNHAFALARQDFFKTLVFDECEHLHDQAHAAWSHVVALRDVAALLQRLSQPAAPSSRAPLDRLERELDLGSPAHEALAHAFGSLERSRAALTAFRAELDHFKRWREREMRSRDERERHGMARAWLQSTQAAAAVAAHADLLAAFTDLDASLAALIEQVGAVRALAIGRIRRALERAKVDLAEARADVEAWIPRHEGVVALQDEVFYDLENDPRAGDALAARVLLPSEFLGRHYYPQLASAAFVSATTWLRGGFECAATYLGLERAAQPLDFEERPPVALRTARAADPFDYGRVRVFVPSDAPDYSSERDRFHDYGRRFVAHLAERTRGRMLVLFTNKDELERCARELEPFFRDRRIPFLWQTMEGARKEELSDLFRSRVDSVLFGVDTFWYGADFAGETLEHLVIVKLPWGVPDRYHHAQCAVLGSSEQRRRIYLPRALAKFRQGFGRLMRRESDRGCVFILDRRVLKGANRLFLAELPLRDGPVADESREWPANGARLAIAGTDACLDQAFEHMGLVDDIRRRGLDARFAPGAEDAAAVVPERCDDAPAPSEAELELPRPPRRRERPAEPTPAPRIDVSVDDLPF